MGPGAFAHGNLAIPFVNVDIHDLERILIRHEQAVPVLTVYAAVVNAFAGGIAVRSEILQGEFQIVVILGGRAITFGIPAGGFRHGIEECGAAVHGARASPDLGTGYGILADERFGKLGHVYCIHAGLPGGGCHLDGGGVTAEIHRLATLYVGLGFVRQV